MLADDIISRSFDGALHGYDKSQVREFLALVADEHKAVAAKVEEAESNLEVLQSRLESLDELVRASGERCRAAEERIAELEAAESRVTQLEAQLEAQQAAAQSRLAELESELETQREALVSVNAGPEDAAKQIGDEVTAVLQAAVAAGQAMRSEAETWAEQLRREVGDEVAELRRVARAEVADVVGRGEERLEQLRASEATLRTWLRDAQSTIEVLLSEPEVPVIQLADPHTQDFAPEAGDWAEDLAVGTF